MNSFYFLGSSVPVYKPVLAPKGFIAVHGNVYKTVDFSTREMKSGGRLAHTLWTSLPIGQRWVTDCSLGFLVAEEEDGFSDTSQYL